MDGADPVELGVELLAKLEFDSIELAEVIDRLETITTDPHLTREILETAERREVIDRDGTDIRPSRGRFVRFESEVVAKSGDFTCRRCGANCSTGYFIRFESGELGPFGGTCVRYLTGRES